MSQFVDPSVRPGPSFRQNESLAEFIDRQPPLLGDDWLREQEERKREEAEFHDRDRAGHRDEGPEAATENRRFYHAARLPDEYMFRWIDRVSPGKYVLDYACGHGAQAIRAARAGAALAVGIDISAVSIQNAVENAQKDGLRGRTRFLQRDCEATGFPDQTFDFAICSGMLHHLDLERALPELRRIMKDGGRVFCYEALSYNPVIQWYRNRTPELRTNWEKNHILGMKDLRLARKWFDVQNVTFFNLVAPLGAFAPPGVLRDVATKVLLAADSVLTRVPLLQYWSWMFTFELVRRVD